MITFLARVSLYLMWLLSVQPPIVQSAFIFVMQRVVPIFARKETRRFFENVSRVHGLPAHSEFARGFYRQCLTHQIHCLCETARAVLAPGSIRIDGFEELRQNIKSVRGSENAVIFITGHIGAWELCAQYAGKAFERPLHVLAKRPRSVLLHRMAELLREQMHVHILWVDRKNLLREMIAALNTKEALGFVMDQKPDGRVGHSVTFLGADTEFVSGPAALSKKFRTPVVSIFAVRVGDSHYRLVSRVIVKDPDEFAGESAITETLAAEIERVIRLFPEQWTWNYKRWKIPALSVKSLT